MANTQYKLLKKFRMHKHAVAAMPSGNMPTVQPVQPPQPPPGMAGSALQPPGAGLAGVVGSGGAGGASPNAPGFMAGQQEAAAQQAQEQQKMLEQQQAEQQRMQEKMVQDQQRAAQQAAQQAQREAQQARAELQKRDQEIAKQQNEVQKARAEAEAEKMRAQMDREMSEHKINLQQETAKQQLAASKVKLNTNSYFNSKGQHLASRAQALSKAASQRLGKSESTLRKPIDALRCDETNGLLSDYASHSKSPKPNGISNKTESHIKRAAPQKILSPSQFEPQGPRLPSTIQNPQATAQGAAASNSTPTSAPATPAAPTPAPSPAQPSSQPQAPTPAQPWTPPVAKNWYDAIFPADATLRNNPAAQAAADKNEIAWISDPRNADPRSIRRYLGLRAPQSEIDKLPLYSPKKIWYGGVSLLDRARNLGTHSAARLEHGAEHIAENWRNPREVMSGVGHITRGILDPALAVSSFIPAGALVRGLGWGAVKFGLPRLGKLVGATGKHLTELGFPGMANTGYRKIMNAAMTAGGLGTAANFMFNKNQLADPMQALRMREAGFQGDVNDADAYDQFQFQDPLGDGPKNLMAGNNPEPTTTKSRVPPYAQPQALQNTGWFYSGSHIANPVEAYMNRLPGFQRSLMSMFTPQPAGFGGNSYNPQDMYSAMQASGDAFGTPAYRQMFN